MMLLVNSSNHLAADPGIAYRRVFFLFMGFSVFGVEFFRQPDAHIGYLSLGLTTGQLLVITTGHRGNLAYISVMGESS